MINKKNIISLAVSLVFIFGLVQITYAKDLWGKVLYGGLYDVGSISYQYMNAANPKTPQWIIADTILIALGFIGIIFLSAIIYGGFRWMFAGGRSEEVERAVSIIKNATIGLIIIFFSYSITLFVTNFLLKTSQEKYEVPAGGPYNQPYGAEEYVPY